MTPSPRVAIPGVANAIIDLTHRLDTNSPCSTCTGHPSFACEPVSHFATSGINVHQVSFGSHTGTHIDAPFHFFERGKRVDELDLSQLISRALVVDVRAKAQPRRRLVWSDVEAYAEQMVEGVMVLFCTGWSRHWGTPCYADSPFLDGDVAKKIIERGVRVIGLDTLSPDEIFPDGDGSEPCFDVHRVVLGAGGVIVENLNRLEDALASEASGGLQLENDLVVSLLPLKMGGCDGSPVRAVAWWTSR